MRLAIVATLLAGAVFAGGSAAAQEATPEHGFQPRDLFPAHLLAGSCSESAELVTLLADGGYGLPVSGTPAAAAHVGSRVANPAIVSVTTIDRSLSDLSNGNFAIDAHTSAEAGRETATRLACGVVGGFRAGNDLVFGLEEANDSDYGGMAWLHDNGDGTTNVALFLASDLASQTGPGEAPADIEVVRPPGGLPPEVEVAGIIIEGGDFVANQVTLREDIPTVVLVVNADEQDYRLQIDDLLTVTTLPANRLSIVEFTTPNWGAFEARLLAEDTDSVLATSPVKVIPAEAAP